MIERLIEKNISFLEKYNSCDEEQISVYRYALQILYTYFIDISILLFISLFFDRLYETLSMIGMFALLQVFGGGYHADSKFKCFFIMLIGCIMGYVLIDINITNPKIIIFISSIISITIASMVPILNDNHPISKKVFIRSKSVVRIALFTMIVVMVVMVITGNEKQSVIIAATLLLYAVSFVIAQLKRYLSKNIKKGGGI